MEKIQIQYSAVGEVNVVADEAMKADFQSLFAHPGWKRYSAMLDAQKKGIFEGLMTAEPKDYAKRIGMAEGLSLSVNLLGHLVLQIQRKEQDKLVAAESKKQSVPAR